jgi:hypothetical protein
MNGDHRPEARFELQRKLRTAAQLEVKVSEELDRLIGLAFEQNWTDRQIADASGLPRKVIIAARAQGGHRLPPIICKGCGDGIERTGRRGKPRAWCTRCKP